MKIKVHFALQENQNKNQLSNRQKTSTKKSTWKPEKNHCKVNTFIQAINKYIEKLLTKKMRFENQTSVSRKKKF